MTLSGMAGIFGGCAARLAASINGRARRQVIEKPVFRKARQIASVDWGEFNSRLKLEFVVQSKLHQPRADAVVRRVLDGNFPETCVVNVLVVVKEIRVIEHVEEFGV